MEREGEKRSVFPSLRTRSQGLLISRVVDQLEGLVAELDARTKQLLHLYKSEQGWPLSSSGYVPNVELPCLRELDPTATGNDWLFDRHRAFGALAHYFRLLHRDQQRNREGTSELLQLLAFFHTSFEGLEVNVGKLLGYLKAGPTGWCVTASELEGNLFMRKEAGLAVCLKCRTWLKASKGGFMAYL